MNKAFDSIETERRSQECSGWSVEDGALVRQFVFNDFPEAVSFMIRIAFESEACKHHPKIINEFNRVAIYLTTHDSGGVITAKDVDLAKRIDTIY